MHINNIMICTSKDAFTLLQNWAGGAMNVGGYWGSVQAPLCRMDHLKIKTYLPQTDKSTATEINLMCVDWPSGHCWEGESKGSTKSLHPSCVQKPRLEPWGGSHSSAATSSKDRPDVKGLSYAVEECSLYSDQVPSMHPVHPSWPAVTYPPCTRPTGDSFFYILERKETASAFPDSIEKSLKRHALGCSIGFGMQPWMANHISWRRKLIHCKWLHCY